MVSGVLIYLLAIASYVGVFYLGMLQENELIAIPRYFVFLTLFWYVAYVVADTDLEKTEKTHRVKKQKTALKTPKNIIKLNPETVERFYEVAILGVIVTAFAILIPILVFASFVKNS